MKVSVNIIGGPVARRTKATPTRAFVEIDEGRTIRELVIKIQDQYPWLREEVGDIREKDEISANVLIGNMNIKWLKGWDTKLKEGDIVTITTMYPRRVK